jgi:hypothetical protein
MGTFNTLLATATCPRCLEKAEATIELKAGDTRHMETFHLGDDYKWMESASILKGGRPSGDRIVICGYTECDLCKRDFFVKVLLVGNRLQSLEPDYERLPYIPDLEIMFRLLCPSCHSKETRLQLFINYKFG